MKNILNLTLLFLLSFSLTAQDQYKVQLKATNIGDVGVSFQNNGVIGNAFGAAFQAGSPSFEYPIGSGIEHLFEAGFWVGGKVNSDVRVSTTAEGEDSNGYGPGDPGYEFTVDSVRKTIEERSTLPTSAFASPLAVSHQDFVMYFNDLNTKIPYSNPVKPILNHTKPLGLKIKLETYAWQFVFTDYFVLLNYTITNVSQDTIKDVYTGMWEDFVVRNVKITAPRGSAFFSAHGNGIIDSLTSIYAFDANGDPGFTNSYVAASYLGGFWRDQYISPGKYVKKSATDSSLVKSNYRFWGFLGADPNAIAPQDDYGRYQYMISSSSPGQIASYKAAGNRSSLMSVGSIPSINPGESFSVVYALTAAKKFGTQNASLDSPEQKKIFVENIQWAIRTFRGEDSNGNGVLDPGEDINGNGKIDRYIVPTPPNSPKIKVVPGNQVVDVYWNDDAEFSVDPISGLQDFEGYRIYKTQLGDELDLTGSMNKSLKLVAQYDVANNNIGFDTGLGSNGNFTNHGTSPVTFPDDTVSYKYHYHFDNLKNGWMYNFAITAFDRPDAQRNIPSLESPTVASSQIVFPGTEPNPKFKKGEPFVYPNPFYSKARWDGDGDVNHRINFANLPKRARISIFTLSGDKVTSIEHNQNLDTDNQTKWFDTYSARTSGQWNVLSTGGEHSWNLISSGNQNVATGLYLFTVEDLDNGDTKTGKFVIIN